MKNLLHLSIVVLLLLSCQESDLPLLCDSDRSVQREELNQRKVLVIGIDGFRSDALLQDNAPFLWNLSTNSSTYFNPAHRTEYGTSSGPNWTSILTGVHQDKHLIANNSFVTYNFAAFPHFFQYIESGDQEVVTASVVHWLPIHYFLTKDLGDFVLNEELEDSIIRDRAFSMLDAGVPIDPDVLFLHFDDIDHFGHGYGFSANIPEYSAAVALMDSYVEELYTTIESKRAAGEDWLVIIVSDHGGEGRSHSGLVDNPNVNQTIFFVNHPTLTFKTNYISSQVDVVPTIFDFMGFTSPYFDCAFDGNSIIDN